MRMPELPEVENVVRGLAGPLSGRTVASARLSRRDLYRTGSLSLSRLNGSKIAGVERIGKAILFRTSPPSPVLVVHLGMTGNLLLSDGGRPLRRRHRHAVMTMDGGLRLEYVDPRRFGFLWVGVGDDLGRTLNIGPDPFQLTAPELGRRLAGRKAPVKSLLLDQRLISGLGNIYVDETLFRASIHPLSPGGVAAASASEMLREARRVLRRAIRHGGTTIRDFRKADGSAGAFGQRLAVYGREGAPCPLCRAVIRRIVIGARSTHFCPNCQRLGR
jgi:formamidopyrimidine-DNA glycosylase